MPPTPGSPPPDALPWPEVAQGEPGPLYGLFGEEDFLVTQGVAAFVASPAFADNPSLNVERLLAPETPPARVLESARTLPFLGRRRLVVVQETEAYTTAQLNQFLPYLEDPAPTTCLVFAGARLNASTRFAKALKARGKLQVWKRMYPRQLVPWLEGRAKLRGKSLTREAAAWLAELAPLGLGALDAELEKLALYVGQRRRITLEDVHQVVGRGRLYGIFDLTDALAAKDLARALDAFAQLEALGEPPLRVVAMVARLWRQLLEVRAVLDAGGDQAQVQRTLRLPPQATRTLTQRARRESAQQLAAALPAVLEADLALKSSPAAPRVVVERLIMRLCA